MVNVVTFFVDIEQQISDLTKRLQSSASTESIERLFSLEQLANTSTLTIEQIKDDIERLSSLKKTEPEVIIILEPFTNTIISEPISLRDKNRVISFNNDLDRQIDQRNNLILNLNSQPINQGVTIGSADQFPTPQTTNNNPLLLGALVLGALLL